MCALVMTDHEEMVGIRVANKKGLAYHSDRILKWGFQRTFWNMQNFLFRGDQMKSLQEFFIS